MNTALRKKIGTGVLALLLSACFIPAAVAVAAPGEGRQERQFHKKGHQRSALGIWRKPQLVQKLGLSDEQVKQIRDADFAFREERLALKGQLDSDRLKMDQAFSDDVVDDAAVLSLAAKISDVKGKLFIQKIESRLELRKILNADQMQKLSLYARHDKKHGSKQGRKRMPGKYSTDKPGDATGLQD